MSDDLNESWDEINPKAGVVVKADQLDLEAHVRLAAAKAVADLETRQATVPRDMVDAFEGRFVHHLLGDLRSVPMQGLIKYVLEASSLKTEDITSFVQALPMAMLKDLTETAVGKTASGVHLVLALEVNRRRSGEGYTLHKLPSGGLRVTFFPRHLQGQAMEVDLNETFDVP